MTIRSNMARICDEFGVSIYGGFQYDPRYNIPPTIQIPVIRQTDGKRQLSLMRWGLVPPWTTSTADYKKLMLNNARADGIESKPSFRSAFKKRRCIVPVDGFYEWETVGKEKLPYYIHSTNGKMLAFAGLWESWKDPDQPEAPPLESCTIITTGPNKVMEPIHDRMPVILGPNDHDVWLDPASTEVKYLLEPCPPDEITAHRVSKVVTKTGKDGIDGPECIEPIAVQASLLS
jgi:putative SOS response-associated peptidase YedK